MTLHQASNYDGNFPSQDAPLTSTTEQIHRAAAELENIDGPIVANISTCGGSVFCPVGKQDSLDLGLILGERLHNIYLPAAICIGVYGCPNHCAETFAKDVGIVGMTDGWDVFVGGRSSRHPKYPWLLARALNVEQVLCSVEGVIKLFRVNHNKNKKLSALIESIGIESFREKVLQDIAQQDK